MKKVVFSLVIFGFLVSCSTKQEKNNQAHLDSLAVQDSIAKADSVKRIAEIPMGEARLDFTARFIAGLPQKDTNTFSRREKDPSWKKFKASMDTGWTRMDRDRLSKIKQWEGSAFSKTLNDTLNLFYPFSGPDFLHAYYLYPKAKVYVLVALEPIVEVQPLDSLASKDRDQFLDSLGHSLRDIFYKSYFITTHMQKDLKQIKGVLPPLYFFIERSGFEVIDQKFITLDQDGKEKEVKAKQLHWQKDPGVKLTLRQRETHEIKTVYYFSISISNGGLKDRPEFEKFVMAQAPFNTFVKSASYLMHISAFTMIRDMILKHTESLFQDDTGIPFRDFKKRLDLSWQFYGEYTKPVKDFGDEKFQPDLDSAYKASKNNQGLPFNLGYHWGTKKQNYMLVKKSGPPVTADK
jgi:hypothetical protein